MHNVFFSLTIMQIWLFSILVPRQPSSWQRSHMFHSYSRSWLKQLLSVCIGYSSRPKSTGGLLEYASYEWIASTTSKTILLQTRVNHKSNAIAVFVRMPCSIESHQLRHRWFEIAWRVTQIMRQYIRCATFWAVSWRLPSIEAHMTRNTIVANHPFCDLLSCELTTTINWGAYD
jgi:hypothetical protein